MRIDIKTVQGRKYLQFVDNGGQIIHVGSASDFDSWLISAILWDNKWREEHRQKRADFFDLAEIQMGKHVQIDSTKMQALQDVIRSQQTGRPLRLPKTHTFGHVEKNQNIKQSRWRPWIWILNEWGRRVQNRLDEIYSKQEQLARKREKLNLYTEKEKLLKKIREQRIIEQREHTQEEKLLLSLLTEMEKETGMVQTSELRKQLAARYKLPTEESEQLVTQLIREGVIYEPRQGYLKKT